MTAGAQGRDSRVAFLSWLGALAKCYSYNIHLLSAYCMPGPVSCTNGVGVNKPEPGFLELPF